MLSIAGIFFSPLTFERFISIAEKTEFRREIYIKKSFRRVFAIKLRGK